MGSREQTIEPSDDRNNERQRFYEHAKKHIDSLNTKFRDKAMIDRVMCEKIINVLQGKIFTDKTSSSFVRWCRKSFTLRLIGGYQLLCDIKNLKPVLLYEDMYEVYRTSHIQTAHGGRDKCQDHISTNYSWSNRSLLQIFISQCIACQTRKSVKIKTVTKPIIVLGTTFFQAARIHFCRFFKPDTFISLFKRN